MHFPFEIITHCGPDSDPDTDTDSDTEEEYNGCQ